MQLSYEDMATIRQSLRVNARQYKEVGMKQEHDECMALHDKLMEFRASRSSEIKVGR